MIIKNKKGNFFLPFLYNLSYKPFSSSSVNSISASVIFSNLPFLSPSLRRAIIVGSISLFKKEKEVKQDKTSIINNYIAYIKINPTIKLEYSQTFK